MAGDAFQKFGDSMGRAITKISVKTSSTLEKSKIKMHIDTLKKDVQTIMYNAGEEAYSLWLNGNNSSESLTAKFETIKNKVAEIKTLTAELDAIDERDKEILGTKPEPVQSTAPTTTAGITCPNCQSACEANAKFCRKCGNKLQ